MINLNYLTDYVLYQIQDYFPLIRMYFNKIENRITFKIETGYYLELLAPEKMKLLQNTKKNSYRKNRKNVPHLEITEVVLVHCNIASNDYKVLHTFVPNKSLGQLLVILTIYYIFLKTFISKFLYIEVWFTDQNSKPLEIEDKINITLIIN